MKKRAFSSYRQRNPLALIEVARVNAGKVEAPGALEGKKEGDQRHQAR